MGERRLRVLIVASHPVPYAIRVFRLLAAHPQLDFQVAFCSLRGAEPEHDPEFGATVQWDVPLLEGYAWSHIPNKGSGAESFFGLRNPGLWSLIRTGNFDVVTTFVSYLRATFWIAYFAARSSGAAHAVGCDQGSLDPRDGRSWKRYFKRFVWPMLFGLADQVCASSSGARDLMRSLRIPEECISLTPLVVDNAWWTARAAQVDRKAVRETWGAKDSDAVVLYCAKLQSWKRPLDLLQAFARAGVAESLLVFAGSGPLREQLESEAAALGFRNRVRFLGFVNQSQLPAVYASADLMVLPSEYEPFAVVVNEAMCCGCPVAASNHVGAARDLVAPVRADFVFPAGDVTALASLLRNALEDRSALAALRTSARAHMQTWSPERSAAALFKAFERAAVHRGRLSRSGAQLSSPDKMPSAAAEKISE